MGNNESGQLGDGTFDNTATPVQIVSSNVAAIAAGFTHSLFLKTDGSYWGMGYNGSGQLGNGGFDMTNRPVQIVSSGVVSIAGGTGHGLLLRSDGSRLGIGRNNYGQLGDGFTGFNSPIPEQIFPSPEPTLTIGISSKTNLQFSATCLFGGVYHLLSTTNIAQPLSDWTEVSTNAVVTRSTNNYGVTITNGVQSNLGQEFFILQSN